LTAFPFLIRAFYSPSKRFVGEKKAENNAKARARGAESNFETSGKEEETSQKQAAKEIANKPQTSPKRTANKRGLAMQLTESYRPRAFDDVVGQDKIIQRIRALAKQAECLLSVRADLLIRSSACSRRTTRPGAGEPGITCQIVYAINNHPRCFTQFPRD
jgi:hypothetical protein